jgi:hypothetical protein
MDIIQIPYNKEKLRKIDRISFFLSFACLIITLGIAYFDDSAFEGARYTTLRDTRIWTNMMDSPTLRLNGTCPHESLDITGVPWQREHGFVRVGVDASRPIFQNQYLHLLWIFAVTCFCQWTRFRNNFETVALVPLSADAESSIKPWYDPSSFVLGSGDTYNPTGPDVGRWIEYALTSPWQVVIVAVNVGIDDFRFLAILWNLQCVMMLQGFLIELCIDKIWEAEIEYFALLCNAKPAAPNTPIKNGNSSIAPSTASRSDKYHVQAMAAPEDMQSRQDRITFLYRVSISVSLGVWIAHVTLWLVLILEFMNTTSSFEDCFQTGPPPFVQYLLILQCLLFTTFGLTQGWQFYHIRRLISATYESHFTGSSGSAENKRFLQDQALASMQQDREQSWLDVTLMYSVLSITAKTVLDVIFIAGTTSRS